jgi:thymidylate synthase
LLFLPTSEAIIAPWECPRVETLDLPYTYPRQWRAFPNPHGAPIDQVKNALDQIKNNPSSRRIIINAWNPAEIEIAALPPCHAFIQFYVANNKLSCQLYQRSCDYFLGGPFNILSYSLLTHIFAHLSNLAVGEFVWTIGDCHIYENQVDAVKEQFTRASHELPQVKINSELKNIDSLKFEDIEIINYISEAFIKIPVSE